MRTFNRPTLGRAARGLIALGLATVAVTLATGSAAATTITPTPVIGSGSDVMFHVSSALDLLYNESPGCTTVAPSGTQPLDQSCIPQAGDITTENANHDLISEEFPIGGSAGVNQLCQQGLSGVASINFARQTSAPSASVCTGLRYVAYARDGLSWEAFPGVAGSATASMNNQAGSCAGSTGFCLTQTQLQGIFVNCTITNWNQVGGANAPITVYSILPQYGTRKAWDLFIGGSSSSCPGVKLVDQTDNSEIAAGDLATAIVPVSVGSWTERYKLKPGGSALGAIDGVAPTLTTVGNGTFPFGRFLYNVSCAGDPAHSNLCGTASPASSATTRYVGVNGWICKQGATAHTKDPITGINYRTEIASTIKKYGFSPLPSGPTGGGTTLTNFCRLFTT
jgi:phosphate transport system substrate-binding protein